MRTAQMARSPAGKTLVSYDNIVQPFPDTQTLLGMARQAGGRLSPTPPAQMPGLLNSARAGGTRASPYVEYMNTVPAAPTTTWFP